VYRNYGFQDKIASLERLKVEIIGKPTLNLNS